MLLARTTPPWSPKEYTMLWTDPIGYLSLSPSLLKQVLEQTPGGTLDFRIHIYRHQLCDVYPRPSGCGKLQVWSPGYRRVQCLTFIIASIIFLEC